MILVSVPKKINANRKRIMTDKDHTVNHLPDWGTDAADNQAREITPGQIPNANEVEGIPRDWALGTHPMSPDEMGLDITPPHLKMPKK